MLDQFNAPSASRATAPPPPASTAAASSTAPAPAASSSAPKVADDLFPDPDDDALPDSLDSLDPQLAKDLEEGMKALLAGLGPGATGSSSGETSTPGTGGAGEDAFDENEFRRVMEELMKGGPGAAGAADADGAGDDEALRNLLAALSMGGGGDATAPASSAKSAPSTAKPAASSSSSSGPSTQPANFQEAIAASMSKLRDSSTSANAAAESSRPGDNAGMAAMLAQMAGMPDLGNIDSEEGLQDMLDEMMKQLMSRDMLYEPLKELADKVRRRALHLRAEPVVGCWRAELLKHSADVLFLDSTRPTLRSTARPSPPPTSSATRSSRRSSGKSSTSLRNPERTSSRLTRPRRRRSGRRGWTRWWTWLRRSVWTAHCLAARTRLSRSGCCLKSQYTDTLWYPTDERVRRAAKRDHGRDAAWCVSRSPSGSVPSSLTQNL